MKNFVRPAILGILLVLGVSLIGRAQLQQSGGPGSTVTVGSALPAGTNVIGHVINDASAAVIGHVITDSSSSQALAAVPTSSTAVFTSTTCVIAILMNNTTGSPVTVTVTDNAGTPINDILTFSIPANSQLVQPLYGIAFSSGVKWAASGAGVTGGAVGFQ